MLTFIIFFPIAGVAAILLLPRERESWAKWIAAGVGAVILALTLTLFAAYDRARAASSSSIALPGWSRTLSTSRSSTPWAWTAFR